MGTKIFSCLFNLLLLTLLANGTDNGPIRRNPVAGGQGGKSVLCYFQFRFAKTQEEQFSPDDFDLTICTHVVYKRAIIGEDLHVAPQDIELFGQRDDDALDLIHRTVALKGRKPGLKLILDLADLHGVINKEKSTNNRESLKTFAKNAVDYIHAQGFDGINFRVQGHEGYMEVFPILREELTKKGYILTTFMPPLLRKDNVENEMTEEFSRNFDLIVIASYWNMARERPAIFSSIRALESDVDAYTANGVPSEKLVVAIPAFCIYLRLCDGEDGGLNSSTCRGSEEEGYDRLEIITNSEMLQKISNTTEGWVISRDEETGGQYGRSNTRQWATCEDPVSVTAKAALVLERNLAGVSIIHSDMEDFKGAFTENGETFPLTRAAYKALNGGVAVEDTVSTTAPST